MSTVTKIKITVLAFLAAFVITVGPAWVGYQLAHGDSGSAAAATDFNVTESVGDRPPPSSHVVAVHAADGDTYTVNGALEATVDGRPILLAQADTGSAAASHDAGPVTASPATQLHDPISSPSASWDDLKAARKVGWPLVVFAGLIMLAKLAKRGGERFAWLARGKTPVVVGALGALGAACYNAAATGGAWSATLFAGVMGLSHFLDAGGKPSA